MDDEDVMLIYKEKTVNGSKVMNIIIMNIEKFDVYIGSFEFDASLSHNLTASINGLGGYSYSCTRKHNKAVFIIHSVYSDSHRFELVHNNASNISKIYNIFGKIFKSDVDASITNTKTIMHQNMKSNTQINMSLLGFAIITVLMFEHLLRLMGLHMLIISNPCINFSLMVSFSALCFIE